MTCGIYKLSFPGYSKCYIGQSVNIEQRFSNHIYRLKNNTHNYKVQEVYTNHGLPTLEIILECSPEELNDAEKDAINIYDSINNGLNISNEPNIFQCGEHNGYSKNSNQKIREVFHLLLDLSNSYKEIEKITGVSISTIRHISNCEAHLWLEQEFPKEYIIMKSYRGTLRQSASNSAKKLGITYPKVINPISEEVCEIANANAFARAHNLDPSYFIKLLNGKALSCKGWKVLK